MTPTQIQIRREEMDQQERLEESQKTQTRIKVEQIKEKMREQSKRSLQSQF